MKAEKEHLGRANGRFKILFSIGGSVIHKRHLWARIVFLGVAGFIFSCSLLPGAPAANTPETSSAPETVEPAATVEPPPDTEARSGNSFAYNDMVVGFLQTGSEGSWRGANSVSFKETAADLGITLKFYDSQNDIENQKAAFRNFIDDEEVNVIVLAALETGGWDSLLQGAKDAGKVVVLEDMRIDAPEDLYATYVGSDFVEEGRKAADAMCQLLDGSAKKNVVELVGNVGFSAAKDRGQGFREKMGDCGITITQSTSANWNAEEGRLAMNKILGQTTNIQGLFAQNDEMALGAIEAIKDSGLNPGKDIKVVSVDASRAAFEAMINGELNVTVECNPLLAPQVYEAALKALNGESLPKWIPSNEDVFWAEDAADIIGTRKY
jgi:ABC-type sugar transport system substrate-binding protein